MFMGIKHKLPSLISLVAIQTSLDLPLSIVTGDLLDAFNAGELETARRLQSLAIEIIAVMARHGGLAAGKQMMRMIGFDCGPVRAPLQNLAEGATSSLESDLNRVGFPLPRDTA